MASFILLFFVCFCLITSAFGKDDGSYKYSEKANTKFSSGQLKLTKNPFRMAKLNLLWEKAVKHLSESKLEILMSELKIHDKEEITLKKMKSDGGDKEGIKEAELRRKLRGIMIRFSLLDSSENEAIKDSQRNEVSNNKILKALFKDKKLNKLWAKAEQSGFSEEELKALKEEFLHHQEKIDEYYAILQESKSKFENEENNLDNEISTFDLFEQMEKGDKKSDQSSSLNSVREKHRELKDGFNHLHKVSSTGPDSKEFLEPKVASLWKLATRADFSQDELESLHTELKHYEHRLLKVRHLSGQLDMLKSRGDEDKLQMDTPEGQKILHERLQKQRRKVEKLHEDLELRILQRHLEL